MNKRSDFLIDLISLADFFDGAGLHSFADQVDEIAKEYHQKSENPHFSQIFSILRNEFAKAVNDPSKPDINLKSLPEILSVLDAVQKENFMVPVAPYYIPKGTKVKFVPHEFYEVAGHIAELSISQKELMKEIEQARDDASKNKLKSELITNNANLNEERKRLEDIRSLSPHSYDIVKKYVENKVNNAGESFDLYPQRI